MEQLQSDISQVDEQIYNDEDLMMKNIVHLVEAYLEQSNEAIGYKRLRDVEKYYEHYEYSVEIKGYIFDYIDQLNNKQLNRNSKAYLDLVNQIRLLQSITYIIVIVFGFDLHLQSSIILLHEWFGPLPIYQMQLKRLQKEIFKHRTYM